MERANEHAVLQLFTNTERANTGILLLPLSMKVVSERDQYIHKSNLHLFKISQTIHTYYSIFFNK